MRTINCHATATRSLSVAMPEGGLAAPAPPPDLGSDSSRKRLAVPMSVSSAVLGTTTLSSSIPMAVPVSAQARAHTTAHGSLRGTTTARSRDDNLDPQRRAAIAVLASSQHELGTCARHARPSAMRSMPCTALHSYCVTYVSPVAGELDRGTAGGLRVRTCSELTRNENGFVGLRSGLNAHLTGEHT